MSYNPKINLDGTYAPFYGWSVISNSCTDLKFLENYIRKHNWLSHYFSALPSKSYHMTIYNIWSNGKHLLPHQNKFLKQNFTKDECIVLEMKSKQIGLFNPNDCIDSLLYQIQHKINKKCEWKKPIKLKIKNILYNGNTIRLSLQPTKEIQKADYLRDEITKICGEHDGMGSYHITLAYKYKDINQETANIINQELLNMNALLEEQTIILDVPFVCFFENMTEFKPFD